MTTEKSDRDRAIERIREWAATLPPEWRAVAEWQIRKGLLEPPMFGSDEPVDCLSGFVDDHWIGWGDVRYRLRDGASLPPIPKAVADLIAKDATTPEVTPEVTSHVDPLDVRKVYVAAEPLPSIEKALEIVHGAREQEYGHPADDLARIGLLWTTHLAGRRNSVSSEHPLTAREVCVMMILLKSARLARTPDHADSLADVVGYVVCSDRIGNRESSK